MLCCTYNELSTFTHAYVFLLQERYMVSAVCHTDEIVEVLHDEYKEQGKPLLFLLYGLNTDSNNFSKPADFKVPLFNYFSPYG